MFGLGALELGIVLAIVLLIFGSAKLPKLARSVAEAQKELKAGMATGAPPVDSESTSARAEAPAGIGEA